MDYEDLKTEMSIFLRVTLAKEKLSENAETCRQQLLNRLTMKEVSPHSYLDMNGVSKSQQLSNCYEEFGNGNIYTNKDQDPKNIINIKHRDEYEYEDNMYINPSSPLANTPVIPKLPAVTKPLSNSSSERNSIISLKKESDRTSDSSSFSSSSTRCDESPEVLAMSPSALRYAASRSGILGRKRKFLFVEHTRFYWVAVVNQTLFVFATDKDNKPMGELNISGYHARPVDIGNNKTDFNFELVAPGKSTYRFVAEKQSDMDKWISAINAASRGPESLQGEWIRQLPSLPASHEKPERRLLLDSEYDMPNYMPFNPDTDKRNITLKEVRQLPLPPHPEETYDQPEPTIRPIPEAKQKVYEGVWEDSGVYHCIDNQEELIIAQKLKETPRCLPSLPLEQETYDQPDLNVRRVVNRPNVDQDECYSTIENAIHTSQEPVYINDDTKNQEEENNYYNLVPDTEKEKDEESIYDVIAEQRHIENPSSSHDSKLTMENLQNQIEEQEYMEKNELRQKPPVSTKPIIASSATDKTNIKSEISKPSTGLVNEIAATLNLKLLKPNISDIKPPIVYTIRQYKSQVHKVKNL